MQNQSCFGGRLIVAPLVHLLLIPSTPMHLKLINNPLCYSTDQIIIREVQLKSCHTLIKKCSFNFFEQCRRHQCTLQFLRSSEIQALSRTMVWCFHFGAVLLLHHMFCCIFKQFNLSMMILQTFSLLCCFGLSRGFLWCGTFLWNVLSWTPGSLKVSLSSFYLHRSNQGIAVVMSRRNTCSTSRKSVSAVNHVVSSFYRIK